MGSVAGNDTAGSGGGAAAHGCIAAKLSTWLSVEFSWEWKPAFDRVGSVVDFHERESETLRPLLKVGLRPDPVRYKLMALDRFPARSLSHHSQARRGRHGRGLPRRGLEARPRGGHQGPSGRVRGQRGPPDPIRARGPRSRPLDPSAGCRDLRGRRGGRCPLPGHGAGAWTHTGRSACRRPATAARRSRHRRKDRSRARGRPRAGHRPPRSQARQRHGRRSRWGQDPGLRPGESTWAGTRSRGRHHRSHTDTPSRRDAGRDGARHRRLHEPGAGARGSG